MGILPDWMIEQGKFITPMAPTENRKGVISYGVTSYGYDARVGYKFKVFSPINATVIDPKAFDPKALVDVDLTPDDVPKPDHVLIPPHSFVLAETVEEFTIPRDVLAVVVGKSTYARCGIIVNVTPLEPEWRGKVTVEISNTTPLPAKIYAGEGIMQILFFRSDGDSGSTCRTSYADKKGKYQGQTGLTLPKVEGA